MPTFPQGATDITNAPSLRAALVALAGAAEVAVDVEADSMHAFRARLCFVQLGTDRDVWLLDTLLPEVKAAELAPLFADAKKTKYFHAAGGDLQYLAEAGVRVNGLFDTHRAATLLGWPKVGLADLARELLQVELAKEHQQSDFSVRPLPAAMRDYIANDVRYLCEIGRRVREACRAADILEEVDLDCQRLADEAVGRPAEGAQFEPKLPKGSLSTEDLAVAYAFAQGLHQRRLRWAEAANVPMGRMLSNAAVNALAQRPPKNLQEMTRAEGVRRSFVREHGDEVMALLLDLTAKAKRGELPPREDDRGARDPKRRKRADLLKTFRTQKAAERKVTPSVVLTNSLADALAAQPPADLDALARIPYFGPKRTRLYGDDLVQLLRL